MISHDPEIITAYRAEDFGETKPRVLIGGKSGKFVPNLNCSFECESGSEQFFINLNRRNVEVTDEKASFDGEKISFSKGDETDVWYIDVKGRLKWNIELHKKPSTRVFEWDLLCSAALKFYYQSALTQAEIDRGDQRPEEVVGSYAIYCDRQDHFKAPDGKTIINYKTGKLAHIYRPLCSDADGAEIYADLLIERAKLVITIPQSFLDSAKYPVTLDPTFGYETQGASSAALTDLYVAASGAGAPASSGETVRMYIYSSLSGTTNVYVGLYTDNAGPQSLVSGSPKSSLSVATYSAQWKQFDMAALSVAGSATYWNSLQVNGAGTLTLYYDSLGGTNRYWDQTRTEGSWGSTFTRSSSSAAKYSMYSEYTTAEIINLAASIAGASNTPDAAAAMVRSLIAAIAGSSLAPDAAASLARNIEAAIAGSGVTPDIAASVTRAILTNIVATTAAPDISIVIARALSAAIGAGSLTPDVAIIIARSLAAGIAASSAIPDITITIQGLISLIANITGSSITPDAAPSVVRALIATIQPQSATADAVATVTRNLIASVAVSSVVPDIAITLEGIINLSAAIAGVSVTPDLSATIARNLTSLISAESVTPEAEASVARELVAAIEGTSLTPDDVIVILAGLGIILDPGIVSITPKRLYQAMTTERNFTGATPLKVSEPVTPERAFGSATPVRTIDNA